MKVSVRKLLKILSSSNGEIYDEKSRTEPRKDSITSRKEEYPEVKIAYSARLSGTKYKYKNGTKLCSQDSLDSVRSINENHITLEQQQNPRTLS